MVNGVVNDNAANVKHGIKLPQYLCHIHTLAIAVTDCFKNTPGMNKVVKNYKALGKFMHQSIGASQILMKEAILENLIFMKVVNPN